MSSFKITCLILLAVLIAVPFAAGQDKPDKTLCPYCKNTGKLPNPIYEKGMGPEEHVIYCSYIMEEDEKAMGLPWIVCERCRNEDCKAKAQAEFDKEIAKRKAWLAERRKIDADLGVNNPLLHLETKHFKWAWNIPKFTFNRKKYRMHDGLHLYAQRMEDFYKDFQEKHKITDLDNFNSMHQMFCFERQTTGRKACMLYGEQASSIGKVTKQTKPSVFVTWWNKSKTPQDEDFHRDMIHNVTHLMCASYGTWWWLYEHGWAYEGSAHWWEIHYYNKATSHCFREVNSTSNWIATKWPAKVKKAVMAGKNPSITDILPVPGGSLSAKDHLFAWSYVDYMMSMDPHKTIQTFDILKKKKPAREAFLKVWGWSVLGFEERWKEYVKKNYSNQTEAAVPKRKRGK